MIHGDKCLAKDLMKIHMQEYMSANCFYVKDHSWLGVPSFSFFFEDALHPFFQILSYTPASFFALLP